MPEALAEFVWGVWLAPFSVRDCDPEAFLATLRDGERVGGRVSLIRELAVQRVHVDTKPHFTPSTVRALRLPPAAPADCSSRISTLSPYFPSDGDAALGRDDVSGAIGTAALGCFASGAEWIFASGLVNEFGGSVCIGGIADGGIEVGGAVKAPP
jgi:hypothetical protein